MEEPPNQERIAILLSHELHPDSHDFSGIYKVPKGATLQSVLEELGVFDRKIVDFRAFRAHKPFGIGVRRNWQTVFDGLIRKNMGEQRLAPFKAFHLQEGDFLQLFPCADCTLPDGYPPRLARHGGHRPANKEKSSGPTGTIVVLLDPRLNPVGAYPTIHRIPQDTTLYSVLLEIGAFTANALDFGPPTPLPPPYRIEVTRDGKRVFRGLIQSLEKMDRTDLQSLKSFHLKDEDELLTLPIRKITHPPRSK